MIRIQFFWHKKKLCGCKVSGHAGFADSGNDIVCASVSSAVQLTANTLTEVFHINANVIARENSVSIKLADDSSPESVKILEGLKLHFNLLKDVYPEFIKINNTEV